MSKQRFRIKFAVYLILRQHGRVLLSERKATGYMDGMLSLVAGHVDGGEPAEQAMMREAREEIGITIRPDDLRLAYVLHRLGDGPDDEYIDLFFECTKWSGGLENRETEKCARLIWCDDKALPDNVIDYVKLVLERYQTGENYLSIQGAAL